MINNSRTNDPSPTRRFISSEKTHGQQYNISRDSLTEAVDDIDSTDEKDELSSYHSNDSYSSAGQRQLPRNIEFVPVTESEVEEHYRNLPFGMRISRLDLNDALEEIEQVLAKKIALEYPIKKTPVHNQHHLSSNSLQRRFDYLRQRQRGTAVDNNMETEAHVGYWWVSEQELREKCPFFRHGESTARAILSLLCSLKRLKRVPAKNKDITYLWL
jgi:hypothetical protein